MHKETDILKDHVPSPLEITEYEQKWNTLVDYVNQKERKITAKKKKKNKGRTIKPSFFISQTLYGNGCQMEKLNFIHMNLKNREL